MITYWFNIPAVLIGAPATCIVIYAWFKFARTGRKL